MEAHYTVHAAAEPQAIPRLLNYFAQQALIPSRLAAREDGFGLVMLSIVQPGIEQHNARIIAEKMRASVLVECVALDFVSSAVPELIPVRG